MMMVVIEVYFEKEVCNLEVENLFIIYLLIYILIICCFMKMDKFFVYLLVEK